ncbi:hypothetical protein C1645_741602 [Glomus cerebriforme]|uniref:Uncharacterized protein n=1 Tax=Glomus cerebriforme TaxID=658196 RepID=A0A397SN81_9GLOM|nr:hypothetical protein C1645_741602 [Glomus cerebriforme]
MSTTFNLVNVTDDLVNAKGNLFKTKLKVDVYNKVIIREPLSINKNLTRKRKHSNRLEIPSCRPPNNVALLDTPNKCQMSDEKKSDDKFKMEILRKIKRDEGRMGIMSLNI